MNRLWEWLLSLFKPKPTPPPNPKGLIGHIVVTRTRHGRSMLGEDRELSRLASEWAVVMANRGSLGHEGFFARVSTVYPNVAAAENVASGYPSPAAVVEEWLQSPGHRANMLGRYNRVGVGVALSPRGTPYWCAIFADLPS